MEAITTAFTSAVALIKADTLTMLAAGVPAALAISGTFIAVRLGIKFFKSIAK